MGKKRRFLAGLFVLASVVLGPNQAQAVSQNLAFIATADNAYAIYTGTGTSATQVVGSYTPADAADIFYSETYTATAQDTEWIYIAAWSDDSVQQFLLAQVNNATTGTIASGDSRWEVTATGINLNIGSPAPTLTGITAQIGLANAGTNPSSGWRPITASTFLNTLPGHSASARYMWWNSGNQGSATAPFTPGFNHSEYLIFRLRVNTTGTPDNTPPTVSSTNPANAATSVFIDSNIVANFSEQLLPATVTTATFTLSGGVTGTVTYSGTTVTFNPNSNLAANTTYTATITTGVTDVSGNALAANYAWTFTTGTSVTPPADGDVPTLPEWATIIMALLLMGLAINQARNRA